MEHADLQLARETLPAVSDIATDLGVDTKNTSLGMLGARLARFVEELSDPKSDLEDKQEPDKRLREVLEAVEKACSWPESRKNSDFRTLKSLAESTEINPNRSFWTAWLSATTPRYRVRKCLKSYASIPENFEGLLKAIEETKDAEPPGETSKFSTAFAEQLGEAPDYPQRVNGELHDVLSFHVPLCQCKHLTRLRLNARDHVQEEDAVCFEVLLSARTDPVVGIGWQETQMLVPSKDQRRFSARMPASGDRSVPVSLRGLCAELKYSKSTLLTFQIENKRLKRMDQEKALVRRVKSADSISLSQALMTYRLAKKTRCILAYTLAKSVWQYYDSKWMDYPWDRENIHLLDDQPVERGHGFPSYLFRPYFAADFHDDQRTLPEYANEEGFWHSYPRVLSLGILLLEIADGQPLIIPDTPLDYTQHSTRRYCWSALRKLNTEVDEFDQYGEESESCLDFDSYREAVDSCLDSDIFDNAPHIKDRRAVIYHRIVYPLKELLRGTKWLAGIDEMKQQLDSGPKRPQRDTLLRLKSSSIQPTHNSRSEAVLDKLHPQSSFLHGKSRLTSASWVDELVSISQLLSNTGNCRPVRIAVLDTGCSLEAPILDMVGQEARLRGHWEDWLEESPKPQDEHGHGTEIVSLLLRILPNAEIFVGRVAKDEEGLQAADRLIAKAINHSATVWMADIITMSFGFPREVHSIKKAIFKAEEERDWSVVFFAAAGNEGSNSEELFPASFDSVISVRGTDCDGNFDQGYDPEVPRVLRGMPLYGTLGVDVPWGWPDEGPSNLSSGCSIATPMAAGIAALIIQCVDSQPDCFGEEDSRKIRTRRAIMEVFHDISVERDRNRRYIAPRNLLVQGKSPKLAMIRAALDRIT